MSGGAKRFYHGTRADLKPEDLIGVGYRSNYGTREQPRLGLIRLGSARFRLLFSEHFPGCFKLPLGARVPGRRIDEGMRLSRLAAGELLGTPAQNGRGGRLTDPWLFVTPTSGAQFVPNLTYA